MKIVPERKLQVEGLRVEIYADRCQIGWIGMGKGDRLSYGRIC